ncbi:MAG: non-heme iron oxygenase ferredoxin subunit [Actinomycetota bacterium]
MGSYIEVASVSDLEDGGLRKVKAGGRAVVLARVGDNYYAASDSCPHQGGSLSMGRLNGTVITCPFHGARFDLAGGSVLHWAGLEEKPPRKARPFVTYEVKVEDGRIYVSLG